MCNTTANLETAMCLWEAFLEPTDNIGIEALKRGLTDLNGTSAVRHMVISWVDECERAWEIDRDLGRENVPYDWGHCPAFLKEKLRALTA